MPSSPEHALTIHLLRLVRQRDPAVEGLPKAVAEAVSALRQSVKALDDAAFDLLLRDLAWQQDRDRLAAAGVVLPAGSQPSALRKLDAKDRVAALRARGQALDDARRIERGEAVEARTLKVPEPREPRQAARIGGAL